MVDMVRLVACVCLFVCVWWCVYLPLCVVCVSSVVCWDLAEASEA